jgi:hypothetical protein
VELVTDRGEDGGWREFSYADIAILAMVRKLVDFGIGVETASLMAREALKNFPLVLKHSNTPPEALTALFAPYLWVIWPEADDQWRLRLVSKPDSEFGMAMAASMANALRIGTGQEITAYITLNIEGILRKAFDRARESSANGDAEQ